ncbi:MAG TPA: hypothetical protein VKN99_07785 [Polyangia bacterium]|nr:hypothetical protein [Polyangia bacterium]
MSFRRATLSLLLVASACSGEAGAGGPGQSQVAQDYPTYRALHESVVTPICGPRGGVCHNSKQFPDLHTPDNMLAAIGARCNQLTEDPSAIQDLCEPQGDLLLIKSGPDSGLRVRIGYAQTDGLATPQSVMLTLHDPVPHSGTNLDFSIVRDTDPQNPIELHVGALLSTPGGQARATIGGLSGLGMGMRYFLTAPYMPGFAGQLILGDPNRNGTFGYDLGGAVIKAGQPEKSFLVQRITGQVPPQMPLANGMLTEDQIYVFQCWIKQMKPDGSNADGPIDYSKCPPRF